MALNATECLQLRGKVGLLKSQEYKVSEADWLNRLRKLQGWYLVCCHSPLPELPCCLRARLQHSFPELTVYSNYQANKGPPCAVMGKGKGVRSRTRGFHSGKCLRWLLPTYWKVWLMVLDNVETAVLRQSPGQAWQLLEEWISWPELSAAQNCSLTFKGSEFFKCSITEELFLLAVKQNKTNKTIYKILLLPPHRPEVDRRHLHSR